MSSILVCISPAESHAGPILGVARAFVAAGHRVRVLTGARFADRIRAIGAEPLALPPEGDILDALDMSDRPRGRKAMNHGLTDGFIRPAEAQLPALRAALEDPPDAIVTDPTFVAAMLVGPDRPVTVMCGIFPLVVSSVDTAPFGLGMAPPRNGPERLRSRAMAWMARRVLLAPVHRDVDEFYRSHGLPGLGDLFFTDYVFQPGRIDLFAQCTVPSFEYPRSDLPACVRFVGPVLPPPSTSTVPEWWDELDGSRPVVHVSQGTVGNADFGELVAPTLDALADEDVTVVVATGRADRRAVGELPPLPANARAAEFLPYDLLMPKVSAFVTNGGYGGLHSALAAGVPIVVAGDTEDKLETSARVAWSGVGINLRTGRPTADAVRKAVRAVLTDPRYREAASRVGREIADYPGADGIVAEVERLVGARMPSSADAAAPGQAEVRESGAHPGHMQW